MDRIDLAILAELEHEGRQPFAGLVEHVGLSRTPCWTRVQALEHSGAIRGYHADVDPAALGLHVTAYVEVMIDPARRDAFEQAVLDHPAIVECVTTAGDADYLLKVLSSDVGDLDDLLRHSLTLLPGLRRSTTTISLKTIKRGASVVAATRSRTIPA
ncbi:Lrp/AsnC family transcriptional regulator [Sphingomonas sp. 2R-10]|uniref:Lrp/AsnC family transcriptional regulator n=1 Tax=Sphingomonas sp. 2R-10 TaxID=3045148 RepID=UPI000F7AF7D5|nr:Lrp/AsnC family transcriptional regulator [Sphingomonas sp. 2R-10]MDJ0277940.1 Lrp/AsnC family transcriptional regulator [Sphingomonas sp. 2R-10]